MSVYESIVESIGRDIELGIYREGERLPSCRELAMEMGINPNTVQRAYAELEARGVIYTIPKKGVFVGGVTPRSGILNAIQSDLPNGTSNSGVAPLPGILNANQSDRPNGTSNSGVAPLNTETAPPGQRKDILKAELKPPGKRKGRALGELEQLLEKLKKAGITRAEIEIILDNMYKENGDD